LPQLFRDAVARAAPQTQVVVLTPGDSFTLS
jgi:hypothetical protein